MDSPSSDYDPHGVEDNNSDPENFVQAEEIAVSVHRGNGMLAQMGAQMAALYHCIGSRHRAFAILMYPNTIRGPLEVPEYFSRRICPSKDLKWKMTSRAVAMVTWELDPAEPEETWSTHGWTEFCKSMRIVEGDSIVVELMSKERRTFRVTVFRFSAYISN